MQKLKGVKEKKKKIKSEALNLGLSQLNQSDSKQNERILSYLIYDSEQLQ